MNMASQSYAKTAKRHLLSSVKLILPFQAAAWRASSEPIRLLLEEPDNDEKDRLTAIWRDTSLSQLDTIGITVRISVQIFT